MFYVAILKISILILILSTTLDLRYVDIIQIDTIQSEKYRCLFENVKVRTIYNKLKCTLSTLKQSEHSDTSEKLQNLPVITNRKIADPVKIDGYSGEPQVAWLETLKTSKDTKLGMIDLNPDIFSVFPRLDLIHQNLEWQGLYRFVDYRKIQTRYEINCTSKKMYPQKGTGRARHSDRSAPQFFGGAQVKGVWGPISYFRLLSKMEKLHGLTSTLTVKFFQNDLHIVDSFELDREENDKQYLENLIQSRKWGNSVLFVNDSDQAPEVLAGICNQIPHYLLIPLYSLSVWSLVKFDTVVMTLSALDLLEHKLISNLLDPSVVSYYNNREDINNTHVNKLSNLKKTWLDEQHSNFHGTPPSHDDYLKYEQ